MKKILFYLFVFCGLVLSIQAQEHKFIRIDDSSKPIIIPHDCLSAGALNLDCRSISSLADPSPLLFKPLEEMQHLFSLQVSDNASIDFLTRRFFKIQRVFPELPRVTALDFFPVYASNDRRGSQEEIDQFFEGLHLAFPNLKTLKFGYDFFNGWEATQSFDKNYPHIDKIALLQQIETLDLIGSIETNQRAVSNERAKGIAGLKHLRSLCLRRCSFSQSDAKVVLSIPTLESLDLTMFWSPQTVINDLDPVPHLERLILSSAESPWGGQYPLCPILKDLNLSHYAPHLKTLSLSYREFTYLNFHTLQYNEELESLICKNSIFVAENMEQSQWGHMPALRSLDFEASNVKGFAFNTFAPGLRYLNVRGTNCGTKDVASIVLLTELEELILEKTKITQGAVKLLSKCLSLKKINLKGHKLTGAAFDQLALLPQLELLDLEECEFSVLDFNKLGELYQIKELNLKDLKNHNISQEMIEELKAQLPHCSIKT